ncbi:bifunctional protein PyrR [Desulfomarina profundi]|uniref:Bifunctional protein PyrR n=1 Tax=Desulfomarina profundi TaxID=2772557 RepID=A0A8D5FMB9_9BACT|nr:bifunctional pyr operon transcriptional regulator/uracil phosphoribosyltransferase PyrR [Desulfomarina profundi]BCL60300.1 bifunctional protein PyrR [Desulfomarina profundi]
MSSDREIKRKTILTEKDIDLAVQRIGLQILERNHDCSALALVGIHTCGVDLARRLLDFIEKQSEVQLGFGTLDINLYRDDWSLMSQNPVVKTTDIGFDVDNADIILVDDVIFTGRTIRAAMDAIMDYGRPNSVQLAVLVDRGGRELPIQPDYTGMCVSVRNRERIQVSFAESGTFCEVSVES